MISWQYRYLGSQHTVVVDRNTHYRSQVTLNKPPPMHFKENYSAYLAIADGGNKVRVSEGAHEWENGKQLLYPFSCHEATASGHGK